MNKLIIISAACLTFACGDISDQNASDIGQEQQAINAPATASYVLGTTTASSRLRCTRTNGGQVCNVPSTRIFTYCVDGPAPDVNEQTDIITALTSLGNDSTGHFVWNFDSHTGSACDADVDAGIANVIVNITPGLCPSGSTNIDSMVCLNPNPGNNLTEVPSGIPGSFLSVNGGILHVDRTHIAAIASTVADQSKVRRHGLVHMKLALEGIGARTDVGSANWTARSAFPFNGSRVLTTGENCTLAFYTSTPTGQYNQDTTSCSAN